MYRAGWDESEWSGVDLPPRGRFRRDIAMVPVRFTVSGNHLNEQSWGTYSQPSCTKNHGKQKHHCNSRITGLCSIGPTTFGHMRKPARKKQCYSLSNRTPIQCLSSTNTIESKHTDQSRQHVCDGVQTSDPLGVLVCDTCNSEDRG